MRKTVVAAMFALSELVLTSCSLAGSRVAQLNRGTEGASGIIQIMAIPGRIQSGRMNTFGHSHSKERIVWSSTKFF